jgi:hypothetical protein
MPHKARPAFEDVRTDETMTTLLRLWARLQF